MRFDLLFVNGVVFGNPQATAVGVSGGTIGHVGSAEGHVGQVVFDLAGRMLMPGFQDAHVHPFGGGLRSIRCNTSDLPSRTAALDEIARYARSCEQEWVYGGGWAFDWFERGCPSKELLDELVPDHPAYLVVRDGHSAWVNSRALELAGITASTPDPLDGRIERVPDGSPQGSLHEGAMRLVDRLLPANTSSDLDRALRAAQARLLSPGITAWQDAWVTPEYHEAYLRACENEALIATVRAALCWDRTRGLDQVQDIVVMSRDVRERYRPGSVKLMLDGVIENFTASMLHPYSDGRGGKTCNHGIDFIAKDDLPAVVIALDAEGLQCHFHALGDGAVRSALDAVEAARLANGVKDLRHHIAHVQVVDPSDVRRFAELGAVANCQPLWACNEAAITELTVPFIGDRSQYLYPFGSLHRNRAILAMGSDWPVSTDDVFHQISVAVTRLPVGGGSAAPLLPNEALDLETAMTAFTAGSAYVNHLDQGRGSIGEGMIADLAVLSSDPFMEKELSGIEVDMTVVDGRPVFDRGRLSG